MSRGIVMESSGKHVIVLMSDGQFRKVRASRKLQIGEEYTFSEQRRMQRPRRLYSFSAGAAALVLMLFVPFFVNHFSKQSSVVAYLTMDVNPSIELGINKDEQVEELRPINDDGADVTAGLSYKGLPLQQVTEAIMDRISAGPYLNSGEGDVVITSVVVGKTEIPAYESDVTSHMDAAVRKSLAKTDKGRKLQVEVTTLSAPKEVRDEAKQEGLSAGKLAFYLMAKKHGYKVTIQELKKESIHQAAKSMGGVAAVMDDDKPHSSDDKPSKGDDKSLGSKPQTSLQAQAEETHKTDEQEKAKEAQREKQKLQLRELLKKEQEKRDKHKGGRRHSDLTNISTKHDSPGNNYDKGHGGKRNDDGVKEVNHSQQHAGNEDNGGKHSSSGGKHYNQDSPNSGGQEDGENSSNGRHNGVNQGNQGKAPSAANAGKNGNGQVKQGVNKNGTGKQQDKEKDKDKNDNNDNNDNNKDKDKSNNDG
ncbi:anti-sigma factor domain-containing protein [Paenibacillus sp. R14(2021)]|uniref:anti-sigma factor domain-containing protein n=1 Tax=Paenibacillus sp. R14(2021) TaxID=2859228 RepID=UPI001C613B1C|nr:anti-sigma factor domain-containing protein [Paenibacillus sp. R14(2021)]